MTLKCWGFFWSMPTLECLKLCRINQSKKAVKENWLSHTTVDSCNNSGFAFLLLTNGLDLHFSILVETHMRKIGGLIFLHSSRVFEFYPFSQHKSRVSNLIYFLLLAFWLFHSSSVPKKNRIMSKTISGIYLVIIFLLYGRSVTWVKLHEHCELMQPISSLTVLLQRHPEV